MTPVRSSTKILKRQRGVSLLEVVVGLSLGLLVLGGVLAIYGPSKKAYRGMEAIADVQEAERFADGIFRKAIQQAGYVGCNVDAPVANTINNIDPNDSWALNYLSPVAGYGADVGSVSTLGIDNSDRLEYPSSSGTYIGDVFYTVAGGSTHYNVTSHDPDTQNITLDGDLTSVLSEDDILMISDCKQAATFVATGVSTSGSSTVVSYVPHGESNRLDNCTALTVGSGGGYNLTNKVYLAGTVDAACIDRNGNGESNDERSKFFKAEYRAGATVTKVDATATNVYYLSPDPANNAIPTLYRHNVFDSIDEPLLAGVDNMRILYGFELSGGTNQIGYATATRFTSNQDVNSDGTPETWQDVRTVQVHLLFRSAEGRGDSGIEQVFQFPDLNGNLVDCSQNSPDGNACPGYLASGYEQKNQHRRAVQLNFYVRNPGLRTL